MKLDQNTLILIAGGIALLYILIGIARTALKVVGTVIVLALGYFFWQGGTVGELGEMSLEALFKEKNVSSMMSRYCGEDKANSLKCECIVTPVYQDLSSRLTPEQINALSTNDDERMKEIKISLKNKKKEIQNCIVKNKGGEAWEKIKHTVEEASNK